MSNHTVQFLNSDSYNRNHSQNHRTYQIELHSQCSPMIENLAIQLSQAITDRKQLRLVFLDGDTLVETVRWHTPAWIGLRDGKVINKQALKFWEPLDP